MVAYQDVFTAYKKSPNDYHSLLKYLKYVGNNDPEKSNKLALGYLNKLDKELVLLEEDNWEILKYVNDYNAEVITYFYNNISEMPPFSIGSLDSLTNVLINKSLRDAIEHQDLTILSICKKIEIAYLKANKTLEEPVAFYHLETDLLYYKHTHNLAKYAELLNTQCHTYYWDDEEELASSAMYFAEEFYDQEEAIGVKSKALNWVQRSRELNDTTWFTYFAEAMVYYHFSEYKKALPMARKALAQKDASDPELQTNLSNFIEDLLELTDYEG